MAYNVVGRVVSPHLITLLYSSHITGIDDQAAVVSHRDMKIDDDLHFVELHPRCIRDRLCRGHHGHEHPLPKPSTCILASNLISTHLISSPSKPHPKQTIYADEELLGPRAPLGVPDWKPFLNFRATCLSVRMRPVPVVFLLLAFSPQLSVCVNVSVLVDLPSLLMGESQASVG